MLSNDDFTVDTFSGDNAQNRRVSDFILHLDYETFRIYGMLSQFYGQFACFGKPEDCVKCYLQSNVAGDYRIAENQFMRWERMMAPHLKAPQGLFKFMFVRPNALIPAYMLRGGINVSAMPIACHAEGDRASCCGVHLGLDIMPRQHDNASCVGKTGC